MRPAVVPAELSAWPAGGEFLILLATAELALAGWVLIRLGRVSLPVTAGASLGTLVLWLYAGTVGLSVGPEGGVNEPLYRRLRGVPAGARDPARRRRSDPHVEDGHPDPVDPLESARTGGGGRRDQPRLGGSGLSWVDLTGPDVVAGQSTAR